MTRINLLLPQLLVQSVALLLSQSHMLNSILDHVQSKELEQEAVLKARFKALYAPLPHPLTVCRLEELELFVVDGQKVMLEVCRGSRLRTLPSSAPPSPPSPPSCPPSTPLTI